MNKEEFIEKLSANGRLVNKRCTESYIANHNLSDILDNLVDKSFGSVSDRIKYLKYGGGYCEVCGIRTNLENNGQGFAKYCKAHFHEPKKNKPAHNRKTFDIDAAIKLYHDEKKSLLEIATLFNVSNVTLANRFKEANVTLRSHSENQKLQHPHADKKLENNDMTSIVESPIHNNTFNISPYLSEKNLYDVLSFVFVNNTINKQVRIKDGDKTYVVDYSVILSNGDLMLVEFNGYHHYTNTKTIVRDYALREYCIKNNIKLVELPYFVQLSNHNFSKYFGINLTDKNITTDQKSGFIASKIVLPYDYCLMGVNRFMADISVEDLTSSEILQSLQNRSVDEVAMLNDFSRTFDIRKK